MLPIKRKVRPDSKHVSRSGNFVVPGCRQALWWLIGLLHCDDGTRHRDVTRHNSGASVDLARAQACMPLSNLCMPGNPMHKHKREEGRACCAERRTMMMVVQSGQGVGKIAK